MVLKLKRLGDYKFKIQQLRLKKINRPKIYIGKKSRVNVVY